jgi:hypothetical protein
LGKIELFAQLRPRRSNEKRSLHRYLRAGAEVGWFDGEE